MCHVNKNQNFVPTISSLFLTMKSSLVAQTKSNLEHTGVVECFVLVPGLSEFCLGFSLQPSSKALSV